MTAVSSAPSSPSALSTIAPPLPGGGSAGAAGRGPAFSEAFLAARRASAAPSSAQPPADRRTANASPEARTAKASEAPPTEGAPTAGQTVKDPTAAEVEDPQAAAGAKQPPGQPIDADEDPAQEAPWLPWAETGGAAERVAEAEAEDRPAGEASTASARVKADSRASGQGPAWDVDAPQADGSGEAAANGSLAGGHGTSRDTAFGASGEQDLGGGGRSASGQAASAFGGQLAAAVDAAASGAGHTAAGGLLHAGAAGSAGGPDVATPGIDTPARQLAPPLHSAGFAPALGAQLNLMVRDGITEARLHLNPAEMGPISVQIRILGQQARVEMVAEQAVTRQVLEQAMPTLAGALRESGLTLTGGGVFDQAQDPRQSGQAGREGQPAGHRQGSAAVELLGLGLDLGPVDGSRPVALPRGVIDVYA